MKRVLITPLDWGLGHATRCIPIINELNAQGCEVVIGASGESRALLQDEFPEMLTVELPGYEPYYQALNGSMVRTMAAQIPKFIRKIRQEHKVVEKLITELKIDFLISDNRYGCWSEKIPCVFITHQSNIMMPKRLRWLQGVVRRMNTRLIRNFTHCWLPDYPGEHSLAGELLSFGSTASSPKVEYIGVLSRFKKTDETPPRYDVIAVFSGPEPQRTTFEEIVLPQLKQSGLTYAVVRGKIAAKSATVEHNIFNYLTTESLQTLIRSSRLIISRSGYSTIMDLFAVGGKAVLVPTPGQTEQEYLAQRLFDQGIAFRVEQGKFNLQDAMTQSQRFAGFDELIPDKQYLKIVLEKFLRQSR